MKKILFITGFTPAEFSAGQHYTANLLHDIGMDHHIDLVYFQYEDQLYNAPHKNIHVVKIIRLSRWNKIVNSILCPLIHPIFTVRFSLPLLFFFKRLVKEKAYDIIYFDFSQVFLYSLFFRRHQKILMAHDIIDQKFSRQGLAFERRWIAGIENIIFKQPNARIYTFSKKDQSLLRDKYDRDSQVVSFYLSPGILELDYRTLVPGDYFVFFAAWNRPENYEGLEWFIRNVLPGTPHKKYIVIGASMPERLANEIDGTGNMRYLGFIENPYSWIAQSHALIAPIFKGAGIKVKVIESLACGSPVIGTNIALEGIETIMEASLVECNTAEQFVREIMSFAFPTQHKARLRDAFLKSYESTRKNIEF